MTDKTQVFLPVVHRLLGLGCHRGAAQILFNAAVQRQTADRSDLRQWTPGGMIPLGPKAEKHLHASNDHLPDPSLSA